MDGVDHAVTLELNPHAMHLWSRKYEVESEIRPAVGDDGMCVHHVNQVVAGCEHVTPGPEVLLETVGG